MEPGSNFSFITSPGGIPLRRRLAMVRRLVNVLDSAVLLEWAEKMLKDALELSGPRRRCVQVRDAVMLAIYTERGTRLRTMSEFRLGKNLQHHDGQWALVVEAENDKTQSPYWLPLSVRVSGMMDRYLAVERPELLCTNRHDFVWVNWKGRPLAKKGVDKRVRWQSKKGFGKAFGSHFFRPCLATTASQRGFEAPLDGAVILNHDPETMIKHYIRSKGFEAASRISDLLRVIRNSGDDIDDDDFAGQGRDPDDG
jgi:hypothetical protein